MKFVGIALRTTQSNASKIIEQFNVYMDVEPNTTLKTKYCNIYLKNFKICIKEPIS